MIVVVVTNNENTLFSSIDPNLNLNIDKFIPKEKYDDINIKARNKNIFGSMLNHLGKAKQRLDTDIYLVKNIIYRF